jgi:hypothetical protein
VLLLLLLPWWGATQQARQVLWAANPPPAPELLVFRVAMAEVVISMVQLFTWGAVAVGPLDILETVELALTQLLHRAVMERLAQVAAAVVVAQPQMWLIFKDRVVEELSYWEPEHRETRAHPTQQIHLAVAAAVQVAPAALRFPRVSAVTVVL